MAIQLPYPYPDPITKQWDAFALLRNLQFLASKIASAISGQLMPSGGIIMMTSGATCPSGYNKITINNGSYLRLSTGAAGGTGGSLNVAVTDGGHTHADGTYATAAESAHTHTVDPADTTSGVPSATVAVAAGAGTTVATDTHTHNTDIASFASGAGSAHSHDVTGSSASATTGISGTIAPTFVDVILCQKT